MFGVSKQTPQGARQKLWYFDDNNPYHQKLRDAIVSGGFPIFSRSPGNILDSFTRAAGLPSESDPLRRVRKVLKFAAALSQEALLLKNMWQDQAREVQKLGDVHRVCGSLPGIFHAEKESKGIRGMGECMGEAASLIFVGICIAAGVTVYGCWPRNSLEVHPYLGTECKTCGRGE